LVFIDGKERTDQRFQVLWGALSIDPRKQNLKAKVMVDSHIEAQSPQLGGESFKQKQ
jgi:hypothetical protein